MEAFLGTADYVPDTLEEETATGRVQPPEKHLDAPILISLLERLISFDELVRDEIPTTKSVGRDWARATAYYKVLRRHPELQYSSFRRHSLSYSSALDLMTSPPKILDATSYPKLFHISDKPDKTLKKTLSYAEEIYDIELTAYCNELKDILTKQEIQRVRGRLWTKPKDYDRLDRFAQPAKFWSDIVDQYRKNYVDPKRMKVHVYKSVKIIFGDGFICVYHNKQWHLAVLEQIQMIQDACLARLNVEVALQIGFHNGSAALPGHVDRILRWQEEVLSRAGNSGYEIVKAPEAIFKTHLNTLTNGDVLSYSSYERTLDKIRAREQAYIGSTSLTDTLVTIVDAVTEIHDAAELFGLTKLSGHPTVYAKYSAASVKEEAKPRGILGVFQIRQVLRSVRHLILSGYIRKHQDWPPFVCEPAQGTELRRHFLNRTTSLPLSSYPLADLDTIIFGKFLDFDYSEDYLKFLDDKAICPGAKEMSRYWYGGHESSPRRLLKAVVEMKHFDLKGTVERMRHGRFYKDELVVELTQKEREFKRAARCFGKLPFAVRTFFTLTEYNIKEKFMKEYLPHQTMTMSNAEQKKRLYDLVRYHDKPNRVLVEADFSRWNLKMCPETVDPVAGELECIFGLSGVFSQIHHFFSKSTFVLTDKHSLPEFADPTIPITEWRESDLVWRNHNKGIEGLAQGLWSLLTIAMVMWALEPLHVSFNLAAQGDNVVFSFDFNLQNGTLATQLRRLLATLEVSCKWLNHTMKPEECIDSRTVLTYGKEIYVKGAHILYNLKFASRSFRRDDTDIPSLSREIASANAIAMQCADSVYRTPLAMFWRSWLVFRVLFASRDHLLQDTDSRTLTRVLQNPSSRQLVALLPGTLGGFPNLGWTRFFMKGEVDDLSWDVPAVLKIGELSPVLASDFRYTLQGAYFTKHPSLRSLIDDPGSLPFSRPSDLATVLKKQVELALPHITKNRWIKQILTSDLTKSGLLLKDTLAKTSPLYPKIMSDIVTLSPYGVKQALLGRFVMTRTITKISGANPFAKAVRQGNSDILRYILHRANLADRKPLAASRFSPYKACDILRKYWGIGVENRNIGVYTPFEYKLSIPDPNHAYISAISRAQTSTDMILTPGPYPPNFGTQTRAKKDDHGIKVMKATSTLHQIERLVLIASQLSADRNLRDVMSSLTSARCPWTIDKLSTFMPVSFGGSALHRHEYLNQAAFAVLGSKTVPTHLNFCSDHAGVLSSGGVDIPIVFQAFYLTLTNWFQVLTQCSVDIENAELAYILSDDYESLPEDIVSLAKPYKVSWPSFHQNQLLFEQQIIVSSTSAPPDETIINCLPATDLRPVDLVYTHLLLCLGRRCSKAIYFGLVNLPVDLFDLKEFNNCPLNAILKGASWFILAIALSVATEGARSIDTTVVNEYIQNIAYGVAGILARPLLHISNRSGQYVGNANVRLQPGAHGGRIAASQLAGELAMSAMTSLMAREMATFPARLILFQGTARSTAFLLRTHLTSLIIMCNRETGNIFLTSYQKRLINDATFSRTIVLDSTGLCIAARRAFSLATEKNHSRAELKNLPILACRTSSTLALRTLRDRRPDPRGRVSLKTTPNNPPSLDIISYQCSDTLGILPVSCDCRNDSSSRRLSLFADHLLRPLGRYASAVSIWHRVFSTLPRRIRGKEILSIGIGHGAVAATACIHGALRVVGIDLRNSFPIINQREGTYIPPEVLEAGYESSFHWHPNVARYGGDVRMFNLVTLPQTTTIMDIEQPFQFTLDCLTRLQGEGVLLLRISCCKHELAFLISIARPKRVFNLSSLAFQSTHTYLLYYTRIPIFHSSGNIESVVIKDAIVNPKQWRLRNHDLLVVFNDRLRPYGYCLENFSTHALEKTISAMIRDTFNFNDPYVVRHRQKIQERLSWILTYWRDPLSLTKEIVDQAQRSDLSLLARLIGLSVTSDQLLSYLLENHT